MRTSAAFLVALLGVLGVLPIGAARGDEVLLEGGGKLVGRAQRVGDEVVVRLPRGETRVKAAEVKSITLGRTVWDEYEDRLRTVEPKDASAHVALGDWCKANGLDAESRSHWRKAVEADADHEGARQRLGFMRHEDRWLTLDEYRRARGLVKAGDEWISQEEARRRDAAHREREASKRHEKTIRDAVVKMASMKRKTRAAGKLALQQYAESIGDTKLGSFASDAAAYYNTYWTAVRQALVRVEVRATWSQLKRPVPTISTSLGAFTNPVTIQLPELSVVSVRTTALVPADIELDE